MKASKVVHRHRPPASVALGSGLLVLAACGARRGPELEQPVGETHTSASSTAGARHEGEDAASLPVIVEIGPEVRTACGMPEPAAGSQEHATPFTFEAGRLRPPRAEDPLRALATCISSEKLGAQTLRVIGHADPRGSFDYAYRLGTYRGAGAKQHLVDLGVSAGRLAVESRGNADARGSDERSWALDRRVEIRLMGVGPQPLDETARPPGE